MSGADPVGPLDMLVGTWAGEGRGFFPTIEPFGYLEEITFGTIPTKPFLTYQQRTRHATEGRPLHAETGYWRWLDPPGPDGAVAVEVVLAHPNGVAEILEGTWTTSGPASGALLLASRAITLTSTAKDVRATRRRLVVEGDTLRYTVGMAAVGVALQDHLEAVLARRR